MPRIPLPDLAIHLHRLPVSTLPKPEEKTSKSLVTLPRGETCGSQSSSSAQQTSQGATENREGAAEVEGSGKPSVERGGVCEETVEITQGGRGRRGGAESYSRKTEGHASTSTETEETDTQGEEETGVVRRRSKRTRRRPVYPLRVRQRVSSEEMDCKPVSMLPEVKGQRRQPVPRERGKVPRSQVVSLGEDSPPSSDVETRRKGRGNGAKHADQVNPLTDTKHERPRKSNRRTQLVCEESDADSDRDGIKAKRQPERRSTRLKIRAFLSDSEVSSQVSQSEEEEEEVVVKQRKERGEKEEREVLQQVREKVMIRRESIQEQVKGGASVQPRGKTQGGSKMTKSLEYSELECPKEEEGLPHPAEMEGPGERCEGEGEDGGAEKGEEVKPKVCVISLRDITLFQAFSLLSRRWLL